MNRLNRFNGMYAYLSGAIDFANIEHAKRWREEITEFLKPMNVKVFNPFCLPFVGAEDIEKNKRPKMAELLANGEYRSLREHMKSMVKFDVRAVDLSSFVIAEYGTKLHLCGTSEEMFTANEQQKPTLLVAVNGKHKMPSWIYARFPEEHIFDGWEDLKFYLNQVNSNPNYAFTPADDKRWVFFNQETI